MIAEKGAFDLWKYFGRNWRLVTPRRILKILNGYWKCETRRPFGNWKKIGNILWGRLNRYWQEISNVIGTKFNLNQVYRTGRNQNRIRWFTESKTLSKNLNFQELRFRWRSMPTKLAGLKPIESYLITKVLVQATKWTIWMKINSYQRADNCFQKNVPNQNCRKLPVLD